MTMRRALTAIPALVAILSLLVSGAAFAAGGGGGGGGGGSTDPCPGGLEPDLQPMVPHHLQIQNTGGREYLRLTNGIANTSGGPWHLHPDTIVSGETGTTTAYQDVWDKVGGVSDPTARIVCSVATTQFEFHPAHNHWHIGSVAQFSVNRANDDGRGGAIGSVYVNDLDIAQSFKTTFCLIDWVKIDDNKKTPEVTYWACDRTAPYQGVSVGWVDQYHHSLEGQEIDLTAAPVGVYYLQVHVNDDGVFLESNTGNNVAWVSFSLSRDSRGNPKIALVSHSPCSSATMCGEGLPNR
jgi:Lysyl oxidase